MTISLNETNGIATANGTQVLINPMRLVDGARSFFKLLQRLLGAALVLAALGLWIIPGASWAADLALVKLSFSLAMGFSGLALWQLGTVVNRIEIELDTKTYEARVVVNAMGRTVTMMQCRFNELQRVDLDKDTLRLWDKNGHFLAEIDLCQPIVKERLLSALRDAGLVPAA